MAEVLTVLGAVTGGINAAKSIILTIQALKRVSQAPRSAYELESVLTSLQAVLSSLRPYVMREKQLSALSGAREIEIDAVELIMSNLTTELSGLQKKTERTTGAAAAGGARRAAENNVAGSFGRLFQKRNIAWAMDERTLGASLARLTSHQQSLATMLQLIQSQDREMQYSLKNTFVLQVRQVDNLNLDKAAAPTAPNDMAWHQPELQRILDQTKPYRNATRENYRHAATFKEAGKVAVADKTAPSIFSYASTAASTSSSLLDTPNLSSYKLRVNLSDLPSPDIWRRASTSQSKPDSSSTLSRSASVMKNLTGLTSQTSNEDAISAMLVFLAASVVVALLVGSLIFDGPALMFYKMWRFTSWPFRLLWSIFCWLVLMIIVPFDYLFRFLGRGLAWSWVSLKTAFLYLSVFIGSALRWTGILAIGTARLVGQVLTWPWIVAKATGQRVSSDCSTSFACGALADGFIRTRSIVSYTFNCLRDSALFLSGINLVDAFASILFLLAMVAFVSWCFARRTPRKKLL